MVMLKGKLQKIWFFEQAIYNKRVKPYRGRDPPLYLTVMLIIEYGRPSIIHCPNFLQLLRFGRSFSLLGPAGSITRYPREIYREYANSSLLREMFRVRGREERRWIIERYATERPQSAYYIFYTLIHSALTPLNIKSLFNSQFPPHSSNRARAYPSGNRLSVFFFFLLRFISISGVEDLIATSYLWISTLDRTIRNGLKRNVVIHITYSAFWSVHVYIHTLMEKWIRV